MKKLVVSPSTAQTQTRPISGSRSISPWPAITPPAITTVSPGAIRPTKAPVSRKAMMPTSRYVQAPSVSRDVADQLLGIGQCRQHAARVHRQRERRQHEDGLALELQAPPAPHAVGDQEHGQRPPLRYGPRTRRGL